MLIQTHEIIEKIKEIQGDSLPTIFHQAIREFIQEIYIEEWLEELKEETRDDHLEDNFVDLEWKEFHNWRNQLLQMITEMDEHLKHLDIPPDEE